MLNLVRFWHDVWIESCSYYNRAFLKSTTSATFDLGLRYWREIFYFSDNPPVEKVDMILAVSSTATLGEQDFKKTKDVIESILNEYGRERFHYGVVLFGKEPKVAVRLGDYYETDEQLMTRLNSFDRDTGSADLAKVRGLTTQHLWQIKLGRRQPVTYKMKLSVLNKWCLWAISRYDTKIAFTWGFAQRCIFEPNRAFSTLYML